MDKNKIILIVSLVVVFLATMFFWLGKTPFTALEENISHLLHLQPKEVPDTSPVVNPNDAGIQGVTDDAIAYSDAEDDSADAQGAYLERLTDVLPLITGPLELSVEGATGWAPIAMPLYSEADTESDVVIDFDDGQVFVILEEQGDWWYVRCSDGETGWLPHMACFINLPDVIPSIVYNITNAFSALTHSSGYEIPGVTGQKLYEAGPVFNPRLSRDEFIVPALYSTSKLLFTAQHLALEAGDIIIMHEAYRDHASQQRSVRLLRELMDENENVRSAIEDGPWNLNWFIATSLSNHQRGVAFDVSLGKILSYEIIQIGDAFLPEITEYEEYNMPTTIHELSPLAAALTRPVSSRDRDLWRDVPLTRAMTPGAKLLQKYFDEAGMTPLASEWWHFNDLEGVETATELDIRGSFLIGEILSEKSIIN